MLIFQEKGLLNDPPVHCQQTRLCYTTFQGETSFINRGNHLLAQAIDAIKSQAKIQPSPHSLFSKRAPLYFCSHGKKKAVNRYNMPYNLQMNEPPLVCLVIPLQADWLFKLKLSAKVL